MVSQKEAIRICVQLEKIAPLCGCHVALTGGSLYKPGLRKDVDLLFYRIRQVSEIDTEKLFAMMEAIGYTKPTGMGWLYKTTMGEIPIDMFFPEEVGGGIYGQL